MSNAKDGKKNGTFSLASTGRSRTTTYRSRLNGRKKFLFASSFPLRVSSALSISFVRIERIIRLLQVSKKAHSLYALNDSAECKQLEEPGQVLLARVVGRGRSFADDFGRGNAHDRV